MKLLLTFFVLCFGIGTIAILFFGNILLNNIWTILATVSLILAVVLTYFAKLSVKIDELTKKINEVHTIVLEDKANDIDDLSAD